MLPLNQSMQQTKKELTINPFWSILSFTFSQLGTMALLIPTAIIIGFINKKPFTLTTTGLLYSTIYAILCGLIWLRFVEKRSLKSTGLTRFKPKQYFLGSLLGASLIILIAIILKLIGAITITPSSNIDFLAVILLLVGYGIQSFSEEFLMRGIIMNAFSTMFGAVGAILINSVIFGIAHLSNPSMSLLPMINICLAGLVFSLLFYKYDNLWLVSGMHALWNFTQGIVMGVEVSGVTNPTQFLTTDMVSADIWLTGGSFGFEGSIVTSIVLILFSIILFYQLKTNTN